jgi:hypothetical protein
LGLRGQPLSRSYTPQIGQVFQDRQVVDSPVNLKGPQPVAGKGVA